MRMMEMKGAVYRENLGGERRGEVGPCDRATRTLRYQTKERSCWFIKIPNTALAEIHGQGNKTGLHVIIYVYEKCY